MRKIIIFLLALLFIPFILHSQSKEMRIGFTGAYPLNWSTDAYNDTKDFNWQWYKELSMNTWSGWSIEGEHKPVRDSLRKNGIDGLFQPDTMIYRAAYGRISIYEAENNYTGRFKYNTHNEGSDDTDVWQGQTQEVRFFDASSGSANTVLSGLAENGEQVFSGMGHIPVKGPNVSWYIKPRMRITTADAFGTVKNVCKIIVKAYNEDIILERSITTLDFRYDDPLTYDGRYLEEFFNIILNVTGNDLTRGQPTDFPQENPPPFANNAVDYQIYWYGEVDLWIDYVKVMDNVAEEFLGPDPRIRNSIINELNYLDTVNTLKGFYTEEIAYNNLRCLQALQQLLIDSSANPNARMICLINDYSYQFNLKTRLDSDYEDYLDMVEPPVIPHTPGFELIRHKG